MAPQNGRIPAGKPGTTPDQLTSSRHRSRSTAVLCFTFGTDRSPSTTAKTSQAGVKCRPGSSPWRREEVVTALLRARTAPGSTDLRCPAL